MCARPLLALRTLTHFSKRHELWGAHRYRRLLSILDPDPAVLRVAGRRQAAVLLLKLRELVCLDRLAFRFRVDAEKFGGIKTQNLVFDRVGQFRVLVLLHELLVHLQLAEADDLALRTAVPYRIGSP